MPNAETAPDLCVIGGSEAGLAACLGAVALGLSCVLVDDGDPSGLRNPELALAALARLAAGGNAEPDRRSKALATIADALTRAAAERRHARFAAMNVRLVRGTGHFLDSASLRAGDAIIRARRFVIATGGVQPSATLAVNLAPGVCLSVADLGSLRHVPPAMLVVGGTAEALAAAQGLARLGCRVTLAAEAWLPDHDPELVPPLLTQLRRDGVALMPARLHLVRPMPLGAAVTLSDGTMIETPHLLLAEPPRPALTALAPAQAGLTMRAGELVLDAGLRTNRRAILAVGRVAGARSAAEGVAQAGHALQATLVPISRSLRPGLVPRVTSTCPEIAEVGQMPSGTDHRIWRAPLGHTGGAALDGIAEGQLKVVTDRRGRVLWVGIVGPAVRELLPFWTLAVSRGLTLADLGDVGLPPASWSESIRAIVVQDLGRRLSAPWLRRAVSVARRLG